MLEWLSQPWHWSVSGILLAGVMVTLLFLEKSFGMSATMRTMCAIGGAGKKIKFFDFDWSTQKWNLIFMLGVVFGGVLASTFLSSSEPVDLSVSTVDNLKNMGVAVPTVYTDSFVPSNLFTFDQLYTVRGFVLIIIGGFMIGFGARYAGGCTSGHAISGLANLQLPSLIAVVGFFIGGIIMTHLLLPVILQL
ncbi:MAG: YeeE/YedE family protein [Aureispira sp.]|nr:YeeE/YedE family protein [Aureispira sp.]